MLTPPVYLSYHTPALYENTGHETSSHALTFALMLLAAHPDEQRALQAEVDTVLEQGKRELKYEDLDRLVLCHGAMNEALRLFPPVVIVPKVCVQDGVELVAGDVSDFLNLFLV